MHHFEYFSFYQIMNKKTLHKQTGSAKLDRHHFFNRVEDDIDVPDGDIEYGRKLYNDMCAGCHNYIGLGPSLISIYGARTGRQKQFTKYSNKTKGLKNLSWSKQRLFLMLECPEAMFGMDSAMTFEGYKDPYLRACIVEYIQFMRLTDSLAKKVKPHDQTEFFVNKFFFNKLKFKNLVKKIMKNLIKNRKFHLIMFEALGSFIFTYGFSTAGLHEAPDIIIASSLFLAISQSGQITGGYINPLITIGTYFDNRHRKLALYILAQMLGAFIGAFVAWALLGDLPPLYKDGWDSFELPKFLLNQLVGSAFFTICVLTLTNRYTSLAGKSWQIYLSVPVALFLVRKMAGNTVLNPAVGICLQMVSAIAAGDPLIFFRDVWPLVVPSILGSLIGAAFMVKIYQPLLLYIKYKDLAEEAEQESALRQAEKN